MRERLIFSAVLVVLLVCPALAASSAATQETAQDWGTIVDPATNCVLINNVWNKRAADVHFTQSVFLKRDGGHTVGGWRWDAPGQGSTVISFPEIACGDSPWNAPLKLRAEFPFRPAEKHLIVDFDVSLHATGSYNMSFEIWAVSGVPQSRQNITHEIMIWNFDSVHQRAGHKIGTVTAGDIPFDVFVQNDHEDNSGSVTFTWTYVAFIAQKPFLEGSLDTGPLMDFLIARRLLNVDSYLTSLEFGNEVTQGAGTVEIRRFAARVAPR